MRFLTSSGCSRTSKPATCGRACGRRQEAGEHAHGGGFAGAVGAEKSDDLSLSHFKGDVIDGSRAGVPFGKIFDRNHKLFIYNENTSLWAEPHSSSVGQNHLKRHAGNVSILP